MVRRIPLLVPVLMLLIAGPLYAAGEGQEDLDKATEAKFSAETVGDLSEVIRLADSALKKGLDESNTEFARKILSSTLVQRGPRCRSASAIR